MERMKKVLAYVLVLCVIITGLAVGEEQISAAGKKTKSKFTKEKYVHQEQLNGYKIFNGIDVSAYQEEINWKKVKKAGVQFAMIRVAHHRGDDGKIDEDAYYQRNIEQATANGINVGVYIFSQAISEKEAREEAKYILERIKGYDITLPVVIDYEFEGSVISPDGGRLKKANLSKEKATKICRAFCKKVKKAGYTPMVYANANMLNNYLNADKISKDYLIWHARYANTTADGNAIDYTGEYCMWQYSSKGKVKGIDGYVDCNFWYKDLRINAESPKKKKSNNNSITLKWKATKGVTGYGVFRYNKKKDKFEKLDDVQGLKYEDTELKSSTTYKYQVKAYWEIGGKKYYSKPSETTQVTTNPNQVTELRASKVASKSISIKWKKQKNASGYYIYKYSKKKDKYVMVATCIGGKSTSYTEDGLDSNKTYKYRVCAYKQVDGKVLKGEKSEVLELKTKKEKTKTKTKAENK